jgi:hypothetical protein
MSGNEQDPWMKVDRITLENYAAGRPRDFPNLGAARVELLRRDNEYAEQQERSRRTFETDMFEAVGKREAARQEFEEKLAQRQMDHAAALASEQLNTARAAAKAAKWAAWAAGVAALGAIGQIIVAALK